MPSTLKRVGVGTDCSGMEAPIQAMANLGINFEHRFSCDIDKNARATITANFPHGRMYEDCTARDNTKAPPCDLYVAGFPCQPFSKAGLGQGFKDKRGRGKIFFFVLDYIQKQRPRAFVLENVAGLVTRDGGKYFKAILDSLELLGEYNITHQILDTKQHGVPQNRRRVYIIGIRKDVDRGTFTFPKPIPCPPIDLFLDSRPKRSIVEAGLPPKTQTHARGNVVRYLREFKLAGKDALKDPFIIDCDSTEKFSGYMHNVTPCLTCRRNHGHWATNRGRRLRNTEMMRLQGMNPSHFCQAVSDGQLGKQLGNTMSVNVLERLLVRLLPAAALATAGRLRDRWEDGSAVKQLARTRDGGFAKTARLMMRRMTVNSGSSKRKASNAIAAAGAKKRARR